MTGAEFSKAVAELQTNGYIAKGRGWKTELAKLLDVSRTTIYKFERDGTDSLQTDLAIAALLHDLDPYPQERLGRPSTVVNRKEQS